MHLYPVPCILWAVHVHHPHFPPPFTQKLGGRLRVFVSEWEILPNLWWKVQMLQGGLVCECTFHLYPCMPYQLELDAQEKMMITSKVLEFLLFSIVKLVPLAKRCMGTYSSIFTMSKKGGDHHLCMNLKPFNQCLQYIRFKMEGMHSVHNQIWEGIGCQ